MLTISNFVKYLIEGLAVSVAAYLVAGKKSMISEIVLLGLTASVTFMILDLFTQEIGGIAIRTVGFGVIDKPAGLLCKNKGTLANLDEGFETGTSVDSEPPNYRNINAFSDPQVHTIGYDPRTKEYGKQETNQTNEQTVNYMGQVPYRFPNVHKSICPQQPVPGTITTIPYGPTKTGSRWMGWSEVSKPVNDNTCEYKIVPGLYGKYIVQPGYRENIKTRNTDKIDNLAPTIWKTRNPIDQRQFGSHDSKEKKNDHMKTGLYEGYENPQTVRLSDAVYSGDIIDLMSENTIMQRGLVNSQIIFDKPLPNVKTNLSKVRLIHAAKKHDPRRQLPIKYGDPLYIKHNAMINNNNESRFIKYGDRLQSHQDGPLFRVYKIYNKKDPKSTDYIRYGDDILISRGDQTGDKTFLKVESDKSVSSESTNSDATTFGLSLERVYELYDRNLCVCPRETIYP